MTLFRVSRSREQLLKEQIQVQIFTRIVAAVVSQNLDISHSHFISPNKQHNDARTKAGLLENVTDDARELHEILNSEMQPFKLVTAFVEVLGRIIVADPSLKIYKKPLERLVCFQLLQHLSTIYDAVLISKFEKMISKLETLSFLDVEYMVVQRAEDPNLRIQIDHQTGTLRFSTDIETRRIRTQLSDLYTSMQGVVPYVEESELVEYRQHSKIQMIEQVCYMWREY